MASGVAFGFRMNFSLGMINESKVSSHCHLRSGVSSTELLVNLVDACCGLVVFRLGLQTRSCWCINQFVSISRLVSIRVEKLLITHGLMR
jgi:hypothetical protein